MKWIIFPGPSAERSDFHDWCIETWLQELSQKALSEGVNTKSVSMYTLQKRIEIWIHMNFKPLGFRAVNECIYIFVLRGDLTMNEEDY